MGIKVVESLLKVTVGNAQAGRGRRQNLAARRTHVFVVVVGPGHSKKYAPIELHDCHCPFAPAISTVIQLSPPWTFFPTGTPAVHDAFTGRTVSHRIASHRPHHSASRIPHFAPHYILHPLHLTNHGRPGRRL